MLFSTLYLDSWSLVEFIQIYFIFLVPLSIQSQSETSPGFFLFKPTYLKLAVPLKQKEPYNWDWTSTSTEKSSSQIADSNPRPTCCETTRSLWYLDDLDIGGLSNIPVLKQKTGSSLGLRFTGSFVLYSNIPDVVLLRFLNIVSVAHMMWER